MDASFAGYTISSYYLSQDNVAIPLATADDKQIVVLPAGRGKDKTLGGNDVAPLAAHYGAGVTNDPVQDIHFDNNTTYGATWFGFWGAYINGDNLDTQLDTSDSLHPKLVNLSPMYFVDNLRVFNVRYGVDVYHTSNITFQTLSVVNDPTGFSIETRGLFLADQYEAINTLFVDTLVEGFVTGIFGTWSDTSEIDAAGRPMMDIDAYGNMTVHNGTTYRGLKLNNKVNYQAIRPQADISQRSTALLDNVTFYVNTKPIDAANTTLAPVNFTFGNGQGDYVNYLAQITTLLKGGYKGEYWDGTETNPALRIKMIPTENDVTLQDHILYSQEQYPNANILGTPPPEFYQPGYNSEGRPGALTNAAAWADVNNPVAMWGRPIPENLVDFAASQLGLATIASGSGGYMSVGINLAAIYASNVLLNSNIPSPNPFSLPGTTTQTPKISALGVWDGMVANISQPNFKLFTVFTTSVGLNHVANEQVCSAYKLSSENEYHLQRYIATGGVPTDVVGDYDVMFWLHKRGTDGVFDTPPLPTSDDHPQVIHIKFVNFDYFNVVNVTNADPSGLGSLAAAQQYINDRKALHDNGHPEVIFPTKINFAIPGTDPVTVTAYTTLPLGTQWTHQAGTAPVRIDSVSYLQVSSFLPYDLTILHQRSGTVVYHRIDTPSGNDSPGTLASAIAHAMTDPNDTLSELDFNLSGSLTIALAAAQVNITRPMTWINKTGSTITVNSHGVDISHISTPDWSKFNIVDMLNGAAAIGTQDVATSSGSGGLYLLTFPASGTYTMTISTQTFSTTETRLFVPEGKTLTINVEGASATPRDLGGLEFFGPGHVELIAKANSGVLVLMHNIGLSVKLTAESNTKIFFAASQIVESIDVQSGATVGIIAKGRGVPMNNNLNLDAQEALDDAGGDPTGYVPGDKYVVTNALHVAVAGDLENGASITFGGHFDINDGILVVNDITATGGDQETLNTLVQHGNPRSTGALGNYHPNRGEILSTTANDDYNSFLGATSVGWVDNFDTGYKGINGNNGQVKTGTLITPPSDNGIQYIFKYVYAGDTNLDGKVNNTDLQNLVANYNQTTNGNTGNLVTTFDGDFNSDGKVDSKDIGILVGNYNSGTPGNPFGTL
jgi:hypothetical protein